MAYERKRDSNHQKKGKRDRNHQRDYQLLPDTARHTSQPWKVGTVFPISQVGKRGSENPDNLIQNRYATTDIGLTAKPGSLAQTNNWDIQMYEFANVFMT